MTRKQRLVRLNTASAHPALQSVVYEVYCTACGQEIPVERWPSHWRMRTHRERRRRERIGPARSILGLDS